MSRRRLAQEVVGDRAVDEVGDPAARRPDPKPGEAAVKHQPNYSARPQGGGERRPAGLRVRKMVKDSA